MNNYVYKPLPKGARVILKELKNCSSIKELAEKTGYKKKPYIFIYVIIPPSKKKREKEH